MKNIEKSNKGALILNSAIWLVPILIFKDDLNFKNSETFKHSVTGLKKHSFENGKVTAAKRGACGTIQVSQPRLEIGAVKRNQVISTTVLMMVVRHRTRIEQSFLIQVNSHRLQPFICISEASMKARVASALKKTGLMNIHGIQRKILRSRKTIESDFFPLCRYWVTVFCCWCCSSLRSPPNRRC